MAVLAQAKEKQAVAPLKAILAGQAHPWVRGRALVALAGILGEGVLEDAIALAQHQAPELRAAARALRETRDAGAIPPLLAHRVGDSAENVKSACEEALLAYEPAALAGPLLAA